MLDKLGGKSFGLLLLSLIAPVVSHAFSPIVTPVVLIIVGLNHYFYRPMILDADAELQQMRASLQMPDWFNDCLDLPLIDPTVTQNTIDEIDELSASMLWMAGLLKTFLTLVLIVLTVVPILITILIFLGPCQEKPHEGHVRLVDDNEDQGKNPTTL